MQNVQCPGCGTLVTVDPAAGQVMGCPSCHTPLNAAPPAAPGAPQGRAGEMPIAAPPPPGSPVAGSRAGEMPVASPPPPPGTAAPPAPQPLSPQPSAPAAANQIAVQAAVQAAAQAAATQAVAAHVAAQSAAQSAAQATPQQATPVATPVGRAAPTALAATQASAVSPVGTQVTSSRRVARRKSTKSTAGLYTVLIVTALGFVVLAGALIVFFSDGSKTRVSGSPSKSTNASAKSAQPDTGRNTGVPAAAAKIQVRVQSVEFAAPRGRDAAGVAKVLEDKCLIVQLKITNIGNAAARYESWYLNPYTAVGGNSADETKLVDDRSRRYSAATFPGVVSFQGHTPKARIAAGESVVDALLFRVPAGFSPRNIKSLRLTLSGKAVNQKSGFQLRINGSKIVEL